MLVVPVAGDKIRVSDRQDPVVVTSYTGMKSEPAVYIDVPRGEDNLVMFDKIEAINGVKVELNQAAKVFEALGVLKRRQNLPQPGDIITVAILGIEIGSPQEKVTVKHLKLHNKAEGLSRGLLVCDEGTCYRIIDFVHIDRKTGSERFDEKLFRRYYFDYLPFESKARAKR